MIRDFEKLLNDKQHGATYILNGLLDFLLENETDLTSSDLLYISKSLPEHYPAMAQMYYLSYKLKILSVEFPHRNLSEIKNFFTESRSKTIEKSVSMLLKIKPAKIITISYSSIVLDVIKKYSEYYPVKITIGEGLPANEGVTAAEKLKENKIPVRIVKDKNLSSLSKSKDIILTGADSFGEEWFINKEGSFELIINGALSGVGTMVCASEDKKIVPEIFNLKYDTDFLFNNRDKIRKDYFEIIPKSIVSYFVD